MFVFPQRAARNIFIDKIRTDERRSLVAGGDRFDEIQVGQEQPAFIVFSLRGVFPDEEHLPIHIGGRFEINVELLVSVAGVFAQDAELAGARPAVRFGDHHLYVGRSIIARIVRSGVRLLDNLIDRQRECIYRC